MNIDHFSIISKDILTLIRDENFQEAMITVLALGGSVSAYFLLEDQIADLLEWG